MPDALAEINAKCPPVQVVDPLGGVQSLLARILPLDLLYDTVSINHPGGAYARYPMFNVPFGRTVAGVVKQKQETNMRKSGMLPTGESFRVLAINFQPHDLAVTFAELMDLIHHSHFVLNIKRNKYIALPVGYLGSGGGEFIVPDNPDNTVASVFVNDYVLYSIPAASNLYQNETDILIPADVEFKVFLEIGVEAAAFGGARNLQFQFDGIRKGPSVA